LSELHAATAARNTARDARPSQIRPLTSACSGLHRPLQCRPLSPSKFESGGDRGGDTLVAGVRGTSRARFTATSPADRPRQASPRAALASQDPACASARDSEGPRRDSSPDVPASKTGSSPYQFPRRENSQARSIRERNHSSLSQTPFELGLTPLRSTSQHDSSALHNDDRRHAVCSRAADAARTGDRSVAATVACENIANSQATCAAGRKIVEGTIPLRRARAARAGTDRQPYHATQPTPGPDARGTLQPRADQTACR
jgi:hypothetical protein